MVLLTRFRKQKQQTAVRKMRGLPPDEVEAEAERIIADYLSGRCDIDTAVVRLRQLYPSQTSIPNYFYQMLIARAHEAGKLTHEDMIAAQKELTQGRDAVKDRWEHIGHPAAIRGKDKIDIQKKVKDIKERLEKEKKENDRKGQAFLIEKEAEHIIQGYLSGDRNIDYTVSMLKHLYPTSAERIPSHFYHMLLERAHTLGRISHADILEAKHELLTGRDRIKDAWEHIGHPEGVRAKQKKIYRHKIRVLENRLAREDAQDHFDQAPVLPASIAHARSKKRAG